MLYCRQADSPGTVSLLIQTRTVWLGVGWADCWATQLMKVAALAGRAGPSTVRVRASTPRPAIRPARRQRAALPGRPDKARDRSLIRNILRTSSCLLLRYSSAN